MRVLVTGASGFSGSFVAGELARRGHDVVGLYRSETAFLARIRRQPHLTVIPGEIGQSRELPGPFDSVIHAAATSPAPGVTDDQIWRDNRDGTAAVVDAALTWKCRSFVFFSSLSLYGNIAGPVLDEESPIVGPDVYGMTKREGEIRLAASSVRLPGLALRLPGVIGPGAHRNWLSSVAANLRSGRPVRAFHLDAPFNNAAHIGDIAILVARVIETGWQGFDAVVLGAAGTIMIGRAIERLAADLGVPARIDPIPAPKPSFILSSDRAIARWRYAPMEIGAMIDRYARELREAQDEV